MKFTAILSCSLAIMVTVVSWNMKTANAADRAEILSKIHTINQNEIQMAKVALDKSSNKDVRNFALRMIKDHTAADADVMKLAKTEKLSVQRLPLNAEQKRTMSTLSALSGSDFDYAYMKAMDEGHEKAADMLEDSEEQVSDPKVKSLVQKLLPKVEHHEELAENILSKEKAKAS